MKKIEIIPALDIMDSQCVRLYQGDFNKCTKYALNPIILAQQFEDIGIERIHIVDLDGAKSDEPKNLSIIEKIAYKTKIKIEFGGGIKSYKSLERVIDSGADRVICGSIAITNPELFSLCLKKFGNEKIVLGADVFDMNIAINGWKNKSETTIDMLIEKYLSQSIKYILCTDISKDGTLKGTSLQLYKYLQDKFPQTHIIASGGIGSYNDILELENIGIKSVVIGKAIYENRITLKELKIK